MLIVVPESLPVRVPPESGRYGFVPDVPDVKTDKTPAEVIVKPYPTLIPPNVDPVAAESVQVDPDV